MQQESTGWASKDAVESAGRNDLKWERPRKRYCPPSSDHCQTSPVSSHHSFFKPFLFLFLSSADVHPAPPASGRYVRLQVPLGIQVPFEKGSHSSGERDNQVAPRQWEGAVLLAITM